MPYKVYCVYILTNKSNNVIYTGVTSNLIRRVFEHKNNLDSCSFTAKYHVHKLVYYECTTSIEAAIAREKQIKAGSRQKKVDLVNTTNPDWKDLYDGL